MQQANSSSTCTLTESATPVFGYLGSAFAVTAVVGSLLALSPATIALLNAPNAFVIMLIAAAVVMFISDAAVKSTNTVVSLAALYGFAAFAGVFVLGLVQVAAIDAVVAALGATAVLVSSSVAFGLTTKRPLSGVYKPAMYLMYAVLAIELVNILLINSLLITTVASVAATLVSTVCIAHAVVWLRDLDFADDEPVNYVPSALHLLLYVLAIFSLALTVARIIN